MKAEPDKRLENGIDISFSITDLASRTSPEPWDGIRNHVAKNNILSMKPGDLAFFYHSSCKVPGIVGTMEIVGEAIPDSKKPPPPPKREETIPLISIIEIAWDPKSPYYDAKSSEDNPKWFCPLVEFRRQFKQMITLEEMKKEGAKSGSPLAGMHLLRIGRLSVSRVSVQEWEFLMDWAERKEKES
jgi:predicted RNA-binding protein with PUA-like domain